MRAVRQRGLRVTAPRRAVIETLLAADRPVSAEEIASGLEGARVPLDDASVYGNLETLERLGVVGHVNLSHGPGRWVLADRARRDYLHCERCGSSRAVESSVLADARAAIRAATGYEARFTHFPIVGLCRACAREGPLSDWPPRAADSRWRRCRSALTAEEWRRVGLLAAVIAGLHVVGFFTLFALVVAAGLRPRRRGGVRRRARYHPYTLGLRHAFDADHTAAIDNTTRKLMSEGQRPLSVGFFFSLGHSDDRLRARAPVRRRSRRARRPDP